MDRVANECIQGEMDGLCEEKGRGERGGGE